MLDSHIIILYTDALYSCPPESQPRYEEFRDMFSRGQLWSKIWLVEELYKVHRLYNEKIAIVGAWFGLLGYLLRNKFVDLEVNCIDLDPRCEVFMKHLVSQYQPERVRGITCDLYEYNYTEDVIINTVCEHLRDMPRWFSKIPSGKIVVLQSTNYTKSAQHVNPVSSLEDFKNSYVNQFSKLLFEGEKKFSMYSRYMLIGIKA
jgi:hypothetical protein